MRRGWVAAMVLAAACGGASEGEELGTAEEALRPEKVAVLIGFAGPADRALVEAHRGEVHSEWPDIRAVGALLPPAAIEALRHNPNVEYIEDDRQVFAVAISGAGEDPWGNIAVGANLVRQTGVIGSGVSVCVIDSGVDPRHPEFSGGNVVAGYDYVGLDAYPWDGIGCTASGDCLSWGTGHGTHVTGTIAAAFGNAPGANPPNGVGVVGVAPGARVVEYRVLGTGGSGSTSSVINALKACKGLPGKRIASLSLGSSSKSRTEERAFSSAEAAGVLIFAAAGNGGGSSLSYPAGYPSVISVAAVDADLQRASFSQTNSDVELAAPGVSVLSSVPRGKGLNGGDYAYFSGTSMATPHASACGALVWAASPSLTASGVRSRLAATARDLGTAGRDKSFGHGLIDCSAATSP